MDGISSKPFPTAEAAEKSEDRRYYVTFGTDHPLGDGYIMVLAETKELGRAEAFRVLGQKWASFYSHEDMQFQYFPAGQYGKTMVAPPF